MTLCCLVKVFEQQGQIAGDRVIVRDKTGGHIVCNPSDPDATLDGRKAGIQRNASRMRLVLGVSVGLIRLVWNFTDNHTTFQIALLATWRSTMRRIELVDSYGSGWEFRQNLNLATQGRDDFLQRGNMHVSLIFQLRQARLFDAKCIRNLLLTLARQLADFAQEQLPEQFLRANRRLGLRSLCGRTFDEIVK